MARRLAILAIKTQKDTLYATSAGYATEREQSPFGSAIGVFR